MRKKYLMKNMQLPGTVQAQENDDRDITVSLLSYDQTHCLKKNLKLNELKDLKLRKNENHWLHCPSVTNKTLLETIGTLFSIHPLLLENIQNTDQRPKVSSEQDFNFLIIKSFVLSDNNLKKNHIAIIVFNNLIISFSHFNNFHIIEKRLLEKLGRIREKKTDYLLFSMLDLTMDDYFCVLDNLEQSASALEEDLLEKNSAFNMNKYISIKKHIEKIRRNSKTIPQIIESLIKSKNLKIKNENKIYYKDLLSSAIQIADISSSMSQNIDNILNISINISGYKMNGIIKVLTIISTIFIPLSFLAGVFGMNFMHIPGLQHAAGFPLLMSMMCLLVLCMIIYFKKKKWI